MDEFQEEENGFYEDDIFIDDPLEADDSYTDLIASETGPLADLLQTSDSLKNVDSMSGGMEEQNLEYLSPWFEDDDQPGHWPNFDPDAADPDAVLGDPATDMAQWHQQTYSDSCAIVSQEFILDTVLDHDFSEEELVELANEKGWYTPGGGTTLPNMGRVMEHFNLEVAYDENCTLEDLSEKLENGEKIIVALDSDEILNPGMGEDEPLALYYGIPGQGANHAVQVIGIDQSDPDNPEVIINDPGTPNGKALSIPAADFNEAWEDSNHYMVSTTGNTVQTVGGYYDPWDVYHYYDGSIEPSYDGKNGYY
ncbi:MAG: hypothetical protein K8S13_10175 [Desulfobacula sp.]|uniref:hypothetical protein n=1 Tax=Desulfobacula sp. TaxID=2593537 RepID=UPI0025C1475E|nr:hypothetical protein [Desulfobacula sp.]MCD4720208.1 hypothetical protein [Desulfobacula sp.]